MSFDKPTDKTNQMSGKYKPGQSGKAYNGTDFTKNAGSGESMKNGYKGSNLSKNNAPGKSMASGYKGSNLKANTRTGKSYTAGYKGNRLNANGVHSTAEGY